MHHFIVARKTLSEQLAADFTKHLFAIRQTLAAEMRVGGQDREAGHRQGCRRAVHPGAAAYIDGELKSFFDRYSDLLYWGLMVMSISRLGIRRSVELQQGG